VICAERAHKVGNNGGKRLKWKAKPKEKISMRRMPDEGIEAVRLTGDGKAQANRLRKRELGGGKRKEKGPRLNMGGRRYTWRVKSQSIGGSIMSLDDRGRMAAKGEAVLGSKQGLVWIEGPMRTCREQSGLVVDQR